jgi:NADPH:quinone reductase-like Zn-dependent oxidoreductase
MRAAFIRQYGGAEELIVAELPTPAIGPQQLLIKVVAAGINPVDFHVRNGMFAEAGMHDLPLVLGWDASGVVVAVGAGVSRFKPGDAVYVHSPIHAQGTNAEYLAVDAELVALKPSNLSFIESAAVPLAALTAWQAFKVAGVQAGDRVLVHGASGGVGSFAVQIAKNLGCHVIATASAYNRAFVEGLGADEFIDYRSVAFEHVLTDMDMVFATVGGNQVLPRSLGIIRAGGHLVSTFDEIPASLAEAHRVHYQRIFVQPDGEALAMLADWIEQGRLSVTLDSVYPLAQVREAQARSEAARAVGKIVLMVQPEMALKRA